MPLNKVKVSTDYITVAFICTSIIMCCDSRYMAAVICTVCHELGHIAVMLMYGCERVDVKINLLNIAITDKLRGVRPYKQDIAVICAGPLVNFTMFEIFGLMNSFYNSEFFYNISVISGLLCVFNLLPIESTDGGQLLEIALNSLFSPHTVRIVMNVLTIVFIIPLACLGFFILLQSRYNYTLLFAVIYFCFVAVMNFTK